MHRDVVVKKSQSSAFVRVQFRELELVTCANLIAPRAILK